MAINKFPSCSTKHHSDFSGSIDEPSKDITSDANTPNIKFLRADVKGMVENDLTELVQSNSLMRDKITIFICLGGDWLGVYTALNWLSWENIDFHINLIGVDINKGLFDINKGLLKNMEKKSISIYNINEILEDYCIHGRLSNNG